ncbi:MAG TPA: glucose-6-phosphate dehydrogenase assembly protein OpcA [Acidimicrobiales bacterium]|nr:glucose-6-phosphate dehydrogenase assembly protein OpcA [Acidimicrobiales bacterium]
MADAVTAGAPFTVLGSWRGESVKMGDVLDAMEGLRRGEQRTATRTSVLSLVIVASDAADARRAAEAVRGLGGRHPARCVLVVTEDSGSEAEPRLCDAEVELVSAQVDGRIVWWEEVTLTVTGAIAQHLDSLIEPLTLPDLPVVVWCAGVMPAPSDPLLRSADTVLVDSKQVGDVDAFPAIVELSRRHTVVDLSWARLEPWRELLAGLFEGRHFRPFVAGVHHVSVAGKEGPRHLLAGWLASRLKLSRNVFHLEDARHVSLLLRASGPGGEPNAEFAVERREGERIVRAWASVEGGPSHRDVLPLPDDSLPWSLADALTHLVYDRTYQQALGGALTFVVPPAPDK